MKKIALIGAGGINSWSALYLREMIDTFYQDEMVTVKIFDKDEIEYEKMMLTQFKESEIFNQSSIHFRLWIEQRIKVIENFISEYYNNA